MAESRRPENESRDANGAADQVGLDNPSAHPTKQEADTVKAASPAAGAAAGAVAGGAAGLAVPVLGPIGAAVGAIIGALGGAAAGTAAGQAADQVYTAQYDVHYQSVWESTVDRPADVSFETVRPAYQYGHLAAAHPKFAGRHFGDIEPELRRRWPADLAARVGAWDSVRRYAEEAYSHARSRGVGEPRDLGVVGTAGSAVNPVERDRSRAGQPSAGADSRGQGPA